MRFAKVIGAVAALTSAMAAGIPTQVQGAPGDGLVVTSNAVNVRTGPSTSARIWVRVGEGEPAIEITRDGEWVRVQLPDQNTEGWIHSSLLAAPGQMPAAEMVATPPATATGATTPEPMPEASATPVAAPEPTAEPPMPLDKPEAEAASGPMVIAPPMGGVPAEETPPDPDMTAAGEPESLAAAPPSVAVEMPGQPGAAALGRFQTSVDYLNDRALSAAGIDLFTEVEDLGDGTVRVGVTDAWALMPPSGRESYLNTLYDRWLAAAGTGAPLSVEIVDPAGQVLSERSGP